MLSSQMAKAGASATKHTVPITFILNFSGMSQAKSSITDLSPTMILNLLQSFLLFEMLDFFFHLWHLYNVLYCRQWNNE